MWNATKENRYRCIKSQVSFLWRNVTLKPTPKVHQIRILVFSADSHAPKYSCPGKLHIYLPYMYSSVRSSILYVLCRQTFSFLQFVSHSSSSSSYTAPSIGGTQFRFPIAFQIVMLITCIYVYIVERKTVTIMCALGVTRLSILYPKRCDEHELSVAQTNKQASSTICHPSSFN